mgnify:CR=1 FL=1
MNNPGVPKPVDTSLTTTLAQTLGNVGRRLGQVVNESTELDEAGRSYYGKAGKGPSGMRISKGRQMYLDSPEGKESLERRKKKDAKTKKTNESTDEVEEGKYYEGGSVRSDPKERKKGTNPEKTQGTDQFKSVEKTMKESKSKSMVDTVVNELSKQLSGSDAVRKFRPSEDITSHIRNELQGNPQAQVPYEDN